MKIGTGIGNINHIEQNKKLGASVLEKIAASREVNAKESASLFIADSLSSQISSLSQGVQNANEAIGILQVADSALGSLKEGGEKLQELSVRYNSDVLNSSDKAILQKEFSSTVEGMMDVVDNTVYNGKRIFGSNLSFVSGDHSTEILLSEIDLSTLEAESQDSIDSFLSGLDTLAADIGSSSNNIEVGLANSLAAISNLTQEKDVLEKSDLGKKINDFADSQNKLSASLIAKNHNTEVLNKQISSLLGY